MRPSAGSLNRKELYKQAPDTNNQIITNLQMTKIRKPRRVIILVIGTLGIGAYLEFGIWSLRLIAV